MSSMSHPPSSSSQNQSDYPPPPWSSPSWGAQAQHPESQHPESQRPREPEPDPELWRPSQAREPATASSTWIKELLRFWPEALVGVIALVIFLQGIGTTSLWFDEAWSFGLANQSLDVMRHYLWGREQNMFLYYLLLHAWLNVLAIFHIPPTEFWVRLPSVFCVTLSAMVVYSCGKRFFGRVAGVFAALLFALNGAAFYAAQQARSYGLQVLLICLGWTALLIALSASNRRERIAMWTCYTLVMALAVYAHLFSLLIFAAQLVFIALVFLVPGPWRERLRQNWRMAAAGVGGVVALIALILIDAKVHGGNNGFVAIPQPIDLYKIYMTEMQGTLNPLAWYLIAASIVLALVAAVYAYVRFWGMSTRSKSAYDGSVGYDDATRRRGTVWLRQPGIGVLALVCWASVPVILSYLGTQPGFNMHLFYQRYLLVIVPALCLLAGVGIATLRWRAAQVIFGLLIVVLLVTKNVPYQLANTQQQDFRTPMAWVQQHYQAGDGLACSPAINCSVPMEYYLNAYPGPAHFDADSPGVWHWPIGTPPNAATLETLKAYAAKHQRVFFLTLHWNPGTPLDGGTKAMQQWLASTHDLAGKVETSTGSVYLYVTKSGGGS